MQASRSDKSERRLSGNTPQYTSGSMEIHSRERDYIRQTNALSRLQNLEHQRISNVMHTSLQRWGLNLTPRPPWTAGSAGRWPMHLGKLDTRDVGTASPNKYIAYLIKMQS